MSKHEKHPVQQWIDDSATGLTDHIYGLNQWFQSLVPNHNQHHSSECQKIKDELHLIKNEILKIWKIDPQLSHDQKSHAHENFLQKLKDIESQMKKYVGLFSSHTNHHNTNDKYTCSICMERPINCAVTPCGHSFCFECINIWKESNPNCPTCRKQITKIQKIYI